MGGPGRDQDGLAVLTYRRTAALPLPNGGDRARESSSSFGDRPFAATGRSTYICRSARKFASRAPCEREAGLTEHIMNAGANALAASEVATWHAMSAEEAV